MKETKTCLSEVELNDYLSGSLSEEMKKDLESHLKDCTKCLEKLVFAYETVNEYEKLELKGVKKMKSTWKRNLWLLGAIIAFVLSFFVSRFFVQLLVATILCGSKWIFDSVNARILIMIYDAWKTGGERDASKILGGLSDRIKG